MELELTAITEAHREAILDYKREFAGGPMDGTAGLANAGSFEDWLAAVRRNGSEETVAQGLVPSSTLLGIRKSDGVVVGVIDIRHRLNDVLLRHGGHIGYSVRPAERRKGYATQMLALALDRCRELGLDRVLVTCNQGNPASAHTILAAGGVLEDERPHDGIITQRYWIVL